MNYERSRFSTENLPPLVVEIPWPSLKHWTAIFCVPSTAHWRTTDLFITTNVNLSLPSYLCILKNFTYDFGSEWSSSEVELSFILLLRWGLVGGGMISIPRGLKPDEIDNERRSNGRMSKFWKVTRWYTLTFRRAITVQILSQNYFFTNIQNI